MRSSVLEDLRYAIRAGARSRVFSFVALLSLAIGIGANTAVFTIADELLIRPTPGVADPGALVDIGRSQDGRGFDTNSYPNFLEIRQHSPLLDGVFAQDVTPRTYSLGAARGAERVFVELVSSNYFDVLGTRPKLGRFFNSQDLLAADGSAEVILSHSFWERRFSSDPRVIGATIDINRSAVTIVGIAPEKFHGTTVAAPDLWIPMGLAPVIDPNLGRDILGNRSAAWLLVGGRRKAGVSLSKLRAELVVLGSNLARQYPTENVGRGIVVSRCFPVPGQNAAVERFVGILMAIAGLVLVVACVNLSAMLLARGAGRRREIAIRLALGAGRARLVRQLVTETTLLFLTGAIVGVALARLMTIVLLRMLPALPIPIFLTLEIDGRVLAFMFGVSAVAALMSGVLPALRTVDAEVLSDLREAAGAVGRQNRLRQILVVSQVAISLLLVVTAGLFLRALERAAAIDPGFDARRVQLASFDFSTSEPEAEKAWPLAERILERVRGIHGAEEASFAAVVPLSQSGLGLGGIFVPGVAPPRSRPVLFG